MTDFKIPELPSDEELGIAGLSEDDLLDDTPDPKRGKEPPASPPPPPKGKAPQAPPSGSRPQGPRPIWRGPVTLLVLLVAAWASSTGPALPPAGAANLPDTEFSSARAMTQLVELARQPHPTGSPEHDRVRQIIVARLTEMGLAPETQTTTSVVRRGETARAATVRNIVARVPGSASTGAILLTAHYDAVPLSSGAGDDGVGVVTILETVRAIMAGPPLENDLIVLITDAEELGLLGARAFVAEHPWMDDVRLALSVEMRGGSGPSIMFETSPENGWIVQAFGAGAARPFANSLALAIYRRMPNDTDFTPFREAGVQGLNFAAIGRPEIYHQASDVPANIQEETIQHHGLQLLGVVRELAGRDLTEVNAPDRVYFRVPLVGLVTYPVSWTPLVSGALLLLVALVLLLARARGHRMAAVGVGALFGLVGVTLGVVAGWGLRTWLFGVHADQGTLLHAHAAAGYALGLVALVLALVAGLYAGVRSRFTAAELAVGAVALATLAAVAIGFVVPLGAMNLQLPVLAALLSAGALASGRADAPPGMARWVACLVLAIPVMILLVPMIELVWTAMSFSLAPVIGGVTALAILLLLPTVEWMGDPNRYWAPLLALGVAGLFVGIGVAGAAPSADRPGHATLLWVGDRTTDEAWWLSADGAGLEWATEQVGAFDEARSMEGFGLGASYRVRPGPPVQSPAPSLAVQTDTVLEGSRRVVLGLDLPLAAELVRLSLPEEGSARFVSVGGDEIPGGPTARLDHWGRPAGTLTFTVTLGVGAPLPTIDVVEHHLRPTELLGTAPFERPAHLLPDPGRSSDRALFRTGVQPGDGGPETVRSDSLPPPPVPDSAGVRLVPDTVADTLGAG